jgi:hypothetical protein
VGRQNGEVLDAEADGAVSDDAGVGRGIGVMRDDYAEERGRQASCQGRSSQPADPCSVLRSDTVRARRSAR